ncbi:hypothetical protein Aspvir_002929 [Aspergillus viridinutans]|uniref:Uncharacterized protein n=1 Tax=Aspergillus viridinutans TaxID=75553 RepID=A0A9P3FAR7_ASPVI|nr:uncharacterized protein Aspvir_002929 [Aspergillus viridinutans]GIK07271.1 hypothetical protein Aspvir_002929 [Aspergillus viridinutans]
MATPESLILRYSGSEFTDEQSFHNHLVEKISEARATRATRDVIYAELVYDNIAPSWMANVGDALERARAGFWLPPSQARQRLDNTFYTVADVIAKRPPSSYVASIVSLAKQCGGPIHCHANTLINAQLAAQQQNNAGQTTNPTGNTNDELINDLLIISVAIQNTDTDGSTQMTMLRVAVPVTETTTRNVVKPQVVEETLAIQSIKTNQQEVLGARLILASSTLICHFRGGQLTRNETRMLHATSNSGKAMHLRSFHLMQF